MRVLEALINLEISLRKRRGVSFRVAHAVAHRAVSRIVPPATVVRRQVHGTELLLHFSHALPHIVEAYPFYDTALPSFAKFLLSRDHPPEKLTVVDVGANIGDTTKLIAAAIGSNRARFICVEADDAYLSLLRHNTEGLDVTIHNVIAGAVSRETHATLMRTGAGTSAILPGGEVHQVIALDDLLGATTQVDLIKIDTDGYEVNVLRGASRGLAQGNATCFIEFSPWHIMTYGKVAPTEVISVLRTAGYVSGIIYDNTGYPMELIDFSSDDRVRNIVSYCLIKPNFYVDLLAAKDRALLTTFYEQDMRRYPTVDWSMH